MLLCKWFNTVAYINTNAIILFSGVNTTIAMAMKPVAVEGPYVMTAKGNAGGRWNTLAARLRNVKSSIVRI